MNAAAIEAHLQPLVGLPLARSHRAADLRNFHFGAVHPHRGGTAGEYALHVQCPWRIDGPGGIVTGRADLWVLPSGEYAPDNWEPQHDNNLQDVQIGRLLGGEDPDTGSYVNATGGLVVEKVWASEFGDAILYLSGGYRLVLVPCGTAGEAWRLFRPGEEDSHFVVDEEDSADEMGAGGTGQREAGG
jgi:hypothetical protein